MNKWIITPLCTGLVLFIGSLIYFSHEVEKAERVYEVKRGSLHRIGQGIGRVEGANPPARLSFRIPGQLIAVKTGEGDRVSQGQVLALLDAAPLDLEIAQARAALKEAQAEEARVKLPARPETIRQFEERLKRAALDIQSAGVRLKNLEAPEQPAPAPAWRIEAARLDVEQARNRYNEAVYERDRLKERPSKDQLAVALAKVRLAQVDLDDVKEKHRIMEKKYWRYLKEHEKAALIQDIERKKRRVELAQAQYDLIKRGPAPAEQNAAEARAYAAKAAYEQAQKTQARLARPPVPPKAGAREIALARAALAQAQSAEREARAALEALKAGPRPEESAAAHAAVERTAKALEKAQARRKEAALRAPFDGVIVGRFYEAGSSPPPYAPVLALQDVTHRRVRAELDALWSADLKPGLDVLLFGKPLGSATLHGKISRVLPAIGPRTLFSKDPSRPKGGEAAVVLIDVEAPKGESAQRVERALRPGLRLDVKVELESRENVLYVPASYVVLEDNKTLAYKAESGSKEKPGPGVPVPVEIGFRDDFGLNVEIRSGLAEGDWIVKPPRLRKRGQE